MCRVTPRKIQAVCVEQSPIEFPPGEYNGDSHVNDCFSHMMAGVLGLEGVRGLERYQPTRFVEACEMVIELAGTEGDAEYRKAKSRCFVDGDSIKIAVDKFETPTTDIILLYMRAMTSRIIIADGSPEHGFTWI